MWFLYLWRKWYKFAMSYKLDNDNFCLCGCSKWYESLIEFFR